MTMIRGFRSVRHDPMLNKPEPTLFDPCARCGDPDHPDGDCPEPLGDPIEPTLVSIRESGDWDFFGRIGAIGMLLVCFIGCGGDSPTAPKALSIPTATPTCAYACGRDCAEPVPCLMPSTPTPTPVRQ